MKYLIFLFCLLCTTSTNYAQNNTISFTISSLYLTIPFFELTSEFKTKKGSGVAALVGFGQLEYANVVEVGGQTNLYILGNFDHGMQLGLEGKYTFQEYGPETDEIISGGPFLGYKVIANLGFTIMAQAGYLFSTTYAKGKVIEPTAFNSPFFKVNSGWSF